MQTVAIVVNALVAAASAWWAFVALSRPGTLSGSVTPPFGEHYFARLYAARALPFQIGVATAPAFSHGVVTLALLIAAAGVQFADALIGLLSGKRDMAAGATAAGAVHVVCALILR